jgi:hypothetical protein
MYRFHLGDHSVRGVGVFDVRRGTRPVGKLVAALMRFPRAVDQVPAQVQILRGDGGSERWIRRIGGRRLDSTQVHDGERIAERFGPVELLIRMDYDDPEVRLTSEVALLCLGGARLRLPDWCAPRIAASVRPNPDDESAPSFALAVEIWSRTTGPLLSYSGYLEEITDSWS